MDKDEYLYLDLHIHSHYSPDSYQSPRKIIETSLRKGLSAIAIVDHNTITGGLKAKEKNKTAIEIITGIEVKTQFGDVIGLFVENGIKEKDFFRLVDKIKEQGGLVVLPHPYKKHRLEPEFLEKIDLIEVFNSRESKSSNEKAEALTSKLSLPFVAGSDAHFPWEIGRGVLKIKKPRRSYNLKEVLFSREKEIIRNYTSISWTVLGQVIKHLKKSRLI